MARVFNLHPPSYLVPQLARYKNIIAIIIQWWDFRMRFLPLSYFHFIMLHRVAFQQSNTLSDSYIDVTFWSAFPQPTRKPLRCALRFIATRFEQVMRWMAYLIHTSGEMSSNPFNTTVWETQFSLWSFHPLQPLKDSLCAKGAVHQRSIGAGSPFTKRSDHGPQIEGWASHWFISESLPGSTPGSPCTEENLLG